MLRFELSVVRESDADRDSIDAAVKYAANIYRSQFGIELSVIYDEANVVSVNSKADMLLQDVQMLRLNSGPHLTADATVFFTRRQMTRGYEGIATIGPACSLQATAVVHLKDDGYDGQILAHELLHTLGVPHDAAPGYLMSESLSRAGSDYASPDTVATVNGAHLEACMSEPASIGDEREAQKGGGGSFDGALLVALVILVAAFRFVRRKS